MSAISFTQLDYPFVLKGSYDELNQALKVRGIAGGLVNVPYDEIDLSYIISGNGTGSVGQVQYKLGGVLVATLTLTYDASNRLIQVVKS